MKRTSPIPRRTRLRPRSTKRQRLYTEERIPLVRALLAEKPICERCHAAPSTDVHELLSRARGGSITDPTNLTCLCRPCHTWITEHPTAATLQGWLHPTPPPPQTKKTNNTADTPNAL